MEEFEERTKDLFKEVHNVQLPKTPLMTIPGKEIIADEKLRDELIDKTIVQEIGKKKKLKEPDKPKHELW